MAASVQMPHWIKNEKTCEPVTGNDFFDNQTYALENSNCLKM